MTLNTLTGLRTTAYLPVSNDTILISPTGTLSVSAVAVSSTGDYIDIINHGTMFSEQSAIRISGSYGSVTNSGSISSLGYFAALELGTFGVIGNWEIINTGLISGSSASGGLAIFSGGNYIANSGEIIGSGGNAIEIGSNFEAGSHPNTIVNTGLIAVANPFDDAIRMTGTGDPTTVINMGEIIGDITFQSDNDVYDGRGGILNGTVYGYFGDDTYIIDDDTTQISEGVNAGTDEVQTPSHYALGDNIENLTLTGTGDAKGVGNLLDNVLRGNMGDNKLAGGPGLDTIEGGPGNDTLHGGGDIDSLGGGDGDDYISAGSGGDVVNGEDGNDVLYGRRGFDVLDGGDGADILYGGDGGDSLYGQQGEDTLIGGGGADKMNGGSGIDVFVWNYASESPDTADFDRISGFVAGEDVLDLSTFGIVDINIGGGITGGGTPSLRTYETPGGDTRVFVDVDGDGTQDMRIELEGTTGLTGSDFLL